MYFATLRGMSVKESRTAIRKWCGELNILEYMYIPSEQLSKGNQQKVQLLSSIIHNPELLILDEPFSGLDPVNTKIIKKALHTLVESGTYIVLSAHQMPIIEEFCQDILILDRGITILTGNLNEIKNTYQQNNVLLNTNAEIDMFVSEGIEIIEKSGMNYTLKVPSKIIANDFLKKLLDNNIHVEKFEISYPSLEDIFVEKVGKKRRPNMRSFFIVIYYTLRQVLKKKFFWVINAIMAIILFLVFVFASIIKLPPLTLTTSPDERGILEITYQSVYPSSSSTTIAKKQEIDIEKNKQNLPNVLIIDNTSIFGDYLELLYETGYNFIIDSTATIETAKESISNEKLFAAVVINERNGCISIEYITLHDLPYNKDDARLISSFLKQIQINKILSELNVPSSDINIANTPISYNITVLKDNTIINNATIISVALVLILYFAISFYSYSISASVASEKTSRVIETLVSSTSPKYIILGKTTAMGFLGIMQLVFLGIVCIFSYKYCISPDLTFLSELIASINITTQNIVLVIAYFALGYTLFAFLSAITGATVSKPEDIQMANLPISLISIVSLVVAFLALGTNQEAITNFATMFPLSSPFTLPGRILTGYADIGEIVVSLTVLILTVILLAFISIRIYSVAILHYGNRLKIKDLFNIFIKIK